MNYATALRLLSRGRNGQKKLANNTYLRQLENNNMAIRLHNTDIIVIRSDDTYVLNSGGWMTVTTKARMNEYTPARIIQKKGVWYIWGQEFCDGMKVDSVGRIMGIPAGSAETSEQRNRLRQQIKAYIAGFSQHVKDGKLEHPSGGDCWCCIMGGPENKMGYDHILSHTEESYYVPSLLLNAIRVRKYVDPGFIFTMIKEQNDSKLAAQVLRHYFKRMEASLLAEMPSEEQEVA